MNRHLLRTNIQKINLIKMLLPGMFLVVLIIILIQFPLINCFFPTPYNSTESLSQLYDSNTEYIQCNSSTLYYTGYDYLKGNSVKGHYYYSLENGKCTLYLFDINYFNEDTPITVSNSSFKARLLNNAPAREQVLTLLARDMNWTYDGLSKSTDTVIISQMHYGVVPSIIIAGIIFIAFSYSLIHILLLLFNICFPVYSYTFFEYGNRRKRHAIVEQAYNELDNSLHFAKDDMYITDNLFICSDSFNIGIIPIDSITWAYKYSRLHKYLLWGEMTYTLKIVTSSKSHYNFLWKSKEYVDLVLDILAARNSNILVGYTPENRNIIQGNNSN